MKRTIFIIAGVTVLLLLLAGAAFMAGRMLGGGPQQGNAMAGPGGVVLSGDGFDSEGGRATSSMTKMIVLDMPEELPDSEPVVLGSFVRQEDNSVFVSEAASGVFVLQSDQSTSASVPASGTETEVVITKETIIYQQVIDYDDWNDMSSSGGTIQMKVQSGSVEEMGEGSIVTVWGDKRGERVVADVVLYSEPVVFSSPSRE